MFVPAVLGCAVPDPGRMAAGRLSRRASGQRRARRADHRVPVRAWPGDARGASGGLRPRRSAGDLHQGLPGPEVIPVGPGRGAGQDGDDHHRADVTGRRAAIRRQPDRRCSGTRARWSRRPSTRWPPAISAAARRRNRGTAGSRAISGRCPGSGRAGPHGRAVIVGRETLFAGYGMTAPATWPRDAGPGKKPAAPPSWPAGTARSMAPSRSPTRSSRRRPPPSPAARARAAPHPADRGQRGHRPGRRQGRPHRGGHRRDAAGRKAAVITGLQAGDARWRWSATASTTPRRWRRRTSGWP